MILARWGSVFGVVLGIYNVTAAEAQSMDRVFAGVWGIVGPESHEMLGTRLRFSDRQASSVHVSVNQMSGLLRRSDGKGTSNYVVRTEAFACYYDVVILTGREEMTWRLVDSGGFNCVKSFRARLDP